MFFDTRLFRREMHPRAGKLQARRLRQFQCQARTLFLDQVGAHPQFLHHAYDCPNLR